MRHRAMAGWGMLALGALTLPVAWATQGTWVVPPVDLSAPGQDGWPGAIAVAPDGAATVVWQRSNGTKKVVQAATRAPGGAFGVPVDLSDPSQDAFGPGIAVAADGTATAVWWRLNGVNEIVQAATRAPGGAFGAPVDLSAPGQNARLPQISVAPDGTAVAVWGRGNGSNTIVQASIRSAGGSFGEPANLSAPGADAGYPQVAVAPDGTAVAVWQRNNGTVQVAQASVRPPGGSFGPAVDLSQAGPAGYDARFPQVAAAPDGTATVVWQRDTDGVVAAAIRVPGGAFGPAVEVSGSGQNITEQHIAVASDGTATVVWRRFNGTKFMIQAATRPPGGVFGTPVDVSGAGSDGSRPQVGSGPDGTTTVVWVRTGGAVQAATRAPGGSFGEPADISAAAVGTDYPSVAVAPGGGATAVWQRPNGANLIVQATQTGDPPFSRTAPAITGTAALGKVLSCDAGLWTGAASVTTGWLRGATSVGVGATHTVAAADAGASLTCQATATNGFGTTQTASSPLAIPAKPGVLARPRVVGRAAVGKIVRCKGARFSRATSTKTSWLRNGRAIRKAAKVRYTIVRADRGKKLACRVAATGPGGTVRATSRVVRVRR